MARSAIVLRQRKLSFLLLPYVDSHDRLSLGSLLRWIEFTSWDNLDFL